VRFWALKLHFHCKFLYHIFACVFTSHFCIACLYAFFACILACDLRFALRFCLSHLSISFSRPMKNASDSEIAIYCVFDWHRKITAFDFESAISFIAFLHCVFAFRFNTLIACNETSKCTGLIICTFVFRDRMIFSMFQCDFELINRNV